MIEFNNLNEIIGMQCTHVWHDTTDELGYQLWNEKTTIRCEVTGFNIEIESKLPYTLNVMVSLTPISASPEWNKKHKGRVSHEIQCMHITGRSIDSIVFD